MLMNWNAVRHNYILKVLIISQETSNLVDAVRELINILQGNPYDYEEEDDENALTEQPEQPVVLTP